MLNPTPGEVFNVVDDNPSSRGAVMEYARGLLGMPPEVTAVKTVSGAPFDVNDALEDWKSDVLKLCRLHIEHMSMGVNASQVCYIASCDVDV